MSRRSPYERITRADWIGDAVLALVAGTAALVAVFLPWANVETDGVWNPSLRQAPGLSGVLATHWGPPLLVLPLLAIGCGAAMLVWGPRRYSGWLGVAIAIAGVAIVLLARDAVSAAYWFGSTGGIGGVMSLFAGILLVPIGLAAAAVGLVLRRQARRAAAVAAPD